MSSKLIIKECLVWLISIAIALVIWYPITGKIAYNHLPLGVFAIVMMIQFFRWFVFYESVLLFQKKYYILATILVSFTIGVVVWSKGQAVLLIAENQAIEDIIPVGAKKIELGMEASYNLFRYLRNLLVFCNFGTPGLAFMLILKIVYKTIGMGNSRVKTYMGR